MSSLPGASPDAPTKPGLVSRLKGVRARIRAHRVGRIAWRSVVTLFGAVVIAIGVVLLAIPGPGWLVIFAGMGVLATEYRWARRLLQFTRRQVARWTVWVKRQNRVVQALLGLISLLFLGALVVGAYWVYAR